MASQTFFELIKDGIGSFPWTMTGLAFLQNYAAEFHDFHSLSTCRLWEWVYHLNEQLTTQARTKCGYCSRRSPAVWDAGTAMESFVFNLKRVREKGLGWVMRGSWDFIFVEAGTIHLSGRNSDSRRGISVQNYQCAKVMRIWPWRYYILVSLSSDAYCKLWYQRNWDRDYVDQIYQQEHYWAKMPTIVHERFNEAAHKTQHKISTTSLSR
jgi:hypothetical protein